MLLVASYIFYGSWDWRFLSLLLVSTLLDYYCGIMIDNEVRPDKRKKYLIISICGDLIILGFFKYFNFFAGNLTALIALFGIKINPLYLHVVLPIGISFYTFQTMSYTIDIYKKRLTPTKKFLDFALYVSFFPQLIAGPIERAKNLLPQVLRERHVTLEKVCHGGYLIFWGLFQKMYVADNLAKIVDPVFNSMHLPGASYFLATYAFMIQMYCDFAGYSNIAKGLGEMMGFEIMTNFYLPFFTCNTREFWKRWHISLTTWIRDYLYYPLLNSRKSSFAKAVVLLLTMSLIGLWHGPAWHFVAFGFYSGIGLTIYHMIAPLLAVVSAQFRGKWIIIYKFIVGILYFQGLMFGFMLFRAQTILEAFGMARRIITGFSWQPEHSEMLLGIALFAGPMLAIEIWQHLKEDLDVLAKSSIWIKIPVYVVMIFLLLIFGVTHEKAFIYFQF